MFAPASVTLIVPSKEVLYNEDKHYSKNSRIINCISNDIIFILNYMAQGRLNRVVNPTFDITKVVAIERASISEHSEVYNDSSFIEYECVYKDSCLDLVNLAC